MSRHMSELSIWHVIIDIFQEKVHTYRLWQVIFQTLIWEMLIYVVDMNFS